MIELSVPQLAEIVCLIGGDGTFFLNFTNESGDLSADIVVEILHQAFSLRNYLLVILFRMVLEILHSRIKLSGHINSDALLQSSKEKAFEVNLHRQLIQLPNWNSQLVLLDEEGGL